MTYTSFDEYLRVKHMEDEPMLTSDMYVDAFDDWLMEQDIDNIIEWADKYTQIRVVDKELKVWKEAKEIIKKMGGDKS